MAQAKVASSEANKTGKSQEKDSDENEGIILH